MSHSESLDRRAPSAAPTSSLGAGRRFAKAAIRCAGSLAVMIGAIGALQTAGLDRSMSGRSSAMLTAAPAISADSARTLANDSTAELAGRYSRAGYSVTPELATIIAGAARKHGIALELAFGLVRTESEFNHEARSPVGAIGLAQLMPATAAALRKGTTRADLRDPARNVDLGFMYLRGLIRQYRGDVEMALLAYNRGPGTVNRILRRGGDPDNGYAGKVLRGV